MTTQSKAEEVFTAEAYATDTKGAVKAEFPNGFTALSWKQGHTVHAKLYDRHGNEIGSQYGTSRCSFFTEWTFPHKGATYLFKVIRKIIFAVE